MEITEVRVKMTGNQNDRVRAFCSVTLDREFVVRDIKIIEGTSGLFVAMPSRKIADHCPKCKGKNHLRAKYCNECGTRLRDNRAPRNGSGRSKLHADIAHPINMACRERLQEAIIEAYESELKESSQEGYKPTRDEDDDLDYEEQDQGTDSTEANEQDERGFDNGAEYAALIAELRNESSKRRGGRPERPKPEPVAEEAKPEPEPEPEPEQSQSEEKEPAPAAEAESNADQGREFGKGIL